jgi:hypothetical protein
MRLFLHNQFSLLVLIGLMSACGLKYTPPETPEAFELRRKKAVEAYVRSSAKDQGVQYESIGFGATQIVKPITYKTLDSLYAIKYRNEQNGLSTDAVLEERIGNQRIIARNDTNQVIYIEDHVFSLTTDTSTEVYAANFQVSSNAVVSDMIIRESTFLPKRDAERYKEYLFNESFLNPGQEIGTAEQKFYAMFTTHFNELSKDQRDIEVRHMLLIMQIAQKRASLGPEGILKTLAVMDIFGTTNVSDFINANQKFTTSNFQFLRGSTDPTSEFTGYTFVLTIEPMPGNGAITAYSMAFDQYYHVIRKEKLY